jgi:hypothetical protein
MATRVVDAKVALVALLNGITFPGTPQPEIKYGQPTEGEDAPFGGEMIFLGESRANAAPVGNMRRRDETFNLRFVVDVRHEGDDEQTTEARAWEILETAEAAIWDDPTIGGTVQRVTGIEASQVNIPEPQAWRTQLVADVACVAAPVY